MGATLNATDFAFITKLALQRSGLVLKDDQQYLASTRLEPLATKQGYKGLAQMVEALRAGKAPALERTVCEALATHESLFFRDPRSFDYLTQVAVPALRKSRPPKTPLRIWSAACSTGQEPYSILMALDGAAQPNQEPLDVQVIATDFSSHAIERARLGIYSAFEVTRGLSPKQRETYFEPHPEGWQVRATHRQRISFREMNLLDGFARLTPIDLLFCRNVLIYFDEATKRQIIPRLAEVLSRDGYLFLGTSETTLHLDKSFRAVAADRVNILQKAEAAR